MSGHERGARRNIGGAGGIRTRYLFNAIEALSRVSYSPTSGARRGSAHCVRKSYHEGQGVGASVARWFSCLEPRERIFIRPYDVFAGSLRLPLLPAVSFATKARRIPVPTSNTTLMLRAAVMPEVSATKPRAIGPMMKPRSPKVR